MEEDPDAGTSTSGDESPFSPSDSGSEDVGEWHGFSRLPTLQRSQVVEEAPEHEGAHLSPTDKTPVPGTVPNLLLGILFVLTSDCTR